MTCILLLVFVRRFSETHKQHTLSRPGLAQGPLPELPLASRSLLQTHKLSFRVPPPHMTCILLLI